MRNILFIAISLIFLQICPLQAEECPARIVSLTPSITEILYELGVGDKVVGVTNYCNFPEDARSKARVGGYLDINYEAIILLKPDLVIMSVDYSEDIRNVLDKSGIEHMALSTVSISGILGSIEGIGQRCGVNERAKEVIARIHKDIDKFRGRAEDKTAKRVMIVVGRNAGALENIYIAGKNSFYDELLTILGHENVYTERDVGYSPISVENILRLNPDIIIEILANFPEEKKAQVRAEWDSLKDVNAVKYNRVYVFSGDYVSIPGPRFTLMLQAMAETL